MPSISVSGSRSCQVVEQRASEKRQGTGLSCTALETSITKTGADQRKGNVFRVSNKQRTVKRSNGHTIHPIGKWRKCKRKGKTPGNQRGKIKCCCCSFGQWSNRLHSQIPLVASLKLANEIDRTLHIALGPIERTKTMERQAKNATLRLPKRLK